MTVGAMLKKLREERGLTQSELADKLGVKQNFISQLESGMRTPSLAISAQLADTLDCTIDEIAGRRAS